MHTRRTLTMAMYWVAVAVIVMGCNGCPEVAVSSDRIMLPMSDGVSLDTRVVHPYGSGEWPVLLVRTPYDGLDSDEYAELALLGYAVVAQNTRGRLASEGDDLVFAADGWGAAELGGHTDGLDTVEWILEQSWCNGDIFTYGGSALGITQNMLAGAAPPNVEGQWIVVAPASLYDGTVFQGGVLRQSQMTGWLQACGFGQSSYDMIEAHPDYDAWWAGLDMTQRQALRDYPVVNIAGWYDTFQQGTIDNFTSIRISGGPVAQEESKLVIALAAHGSNHGALEWPEGSGSESRYDMLDFLAHYAKGEDNGFDELPRVAYYLMGDLENPDAPGNEWQYADDWPVPSSEVSFYLDNDSTLSLTAPDAGADPLTYVYDPTNPVPTLGGANLMIERGNHDQREVEIRDDVLLFDYGPLEEPLEVVGRIWVYLYVSSDCVDTDFTAKVTDVYPDGKSIILCDGIRKARYRNGFEEATLMTPGEVYEIPIDVWSTAMVFDEGHTIRVAISSSNAPRFVPNPNTGAAPALDDPVNPVSASNSVYMDDVHASRAVLPITGPDDDGDGVPNIVDDE